MKILVDADQKTWHLDNETERADFNNVKNTLWVEGYQDNDTVSVTTEYRDPSNNLSCSDTVTYTFIGAVCGRQPTPAERTAMGNDYPNITHCEWSTTGEPTDDYNCIAWSVGITNEWIWLEVDTDFGDNDGILEVSDFDAFYDDEGYQTCAEAEAVIMPYKNPAKAVPKNPDGITHGARKRDCGSNNCGAGRWNMFESKLGDTERIEHRKAQLNGAAGAGYGAPFRYYKPK